MEFPDDNRFNADSQGEFSDEYKPTTPDDGTDQQPQDGGSSFEASPADSTDFYPAGRLDETDNGSGVYDAVVLPHHGHHRVLASVAGLAVFAGGFGIGYVTNRPASAHDKTVAVSTSGSASPKPTKSKPSPKSTNQSNSGALKAACKDAKLNQIADEIIPDSSCISGTLDSTTESAGWESKDGNAAVLITYSTDVASNAKTREADDYAEQTGGLEKKVSISGLECYVPYFVKTDGSKLDTPGATLCFTVDNGKLIQVNTPEGTNAQALSVARETISLMQQAN